MERMTVKCKDGVVRLSANVTADIAVDRLASYEDTGLTPEQIKTIILGSAAMNFENLNGYPINELIRLYKAEQEGRLVVLPCKPGDTVYRIAHDEDGNPYIVKDLCVGIRIGLSGDFLMVTPGDRRWNVEKFGKSIFCTREAAEAALSGSE